METDDGQAISFPLVQIVLLMDCTHVLPFHYFGNKYASNRADKSMTLFGLVTDSVGIFTIYDLFIARRQRKNVYKHSSYSILYTITLGPL